jgi:hypothetical protein
MSTQKRQIKTYSSRNIGRNAIFCPSCKLKLDVPLDACPSCGFTGQHTVAMFGLQAPALAPIVDPKDFLAPRQKNRILPHIARFQKKLPQLRLCFLFTEVPAHYDFHLYAYWYCNVAPLGPSEKPEDRLWTILVAYDTNMHRMAVVPCYKIEPFVSDDQWDFLLRAAQTRWKIRETVSIEYFILLLRDYLSKASQRIRGKRKDES